MKRSKFSLTHDKLLSCNMGELIPIAAVEVLPGDQFQHATSALVRVAPILAPIMTPTHAMIHHFFVPWRLVWDNWEDFITGGPNGTSLPVPPYMTYPASPGYDIGTLADYFGLRTGPNPAGARHSALYMRAYALIWNEFFRDQDLQNELVISKADGADTTTSKLLQNVAWGKDRFTTARPWPQKGATTYIPLGTSAPVKLVATPPAGANLLKTRSTLAVTPSVAAIATDASGNITNGAGVGQVIDPNGALYADLTAASAVSITDLRTAAAIQRYKELMGKFGSRYVEYLRTIFGVKSSDARLQRPEYLGGGIQTIQFSEVLQTAEGTNPVGTMRGHGITALRSNRYRRFFEEHGVVISLISVKPKSLYMQGQNRKWNRETKEDYFNPVLQFIGQQEIENRELFVQGTAGGAADLATWGYQDRYAEYKSEDSTVSGEFRTTLNYWHMGRDFSSLPALNSAFITANPTTRVYASTNTDQLYIMAHHSIQARRPVSKSDASYLS